MPYELVKISNKQCKSFWLVLILSFCAFLFINTIFNRFEHFDQMKQNKLKPFRPSKFFKKKKTIY